MRVNSNFSEENSYRYPINIGSHYSAGFRCSTRTSYGTFRLYLNVNYSPVVSARARANCRREIIPSRQSPRIADEQQR